MSGTQALRLDWLEGPRALEGIAEEWRDLCVRTGADLYLGPDWVLTWWRHFGPGRDRLRALTARDGAGRLAGVLPFMTETVVAGPLPVRLARLAATDPHTLVLRLPAEADAVAPMIGKALADLLDDVALVSLTPASARGPLPDAVTRAAAGNPAAPWRVIETQQGTHTMFDLPESFETYLAGLSKKRRGQFRRDLGKLEDDHGLRPAFVHPDPDAMDRFVAFHAVQWEETGRGGHFADWPGSAPFYRDLAARLGGTDPLWLDWYDGAREPLAAQFGLKSGETFHWRLPARSVDPEVERLSIGKVGLILMIRRLIEAGVRVIEGGMGVYDYKTSHGAEDVPVSRLIVARNGPGTGVRLTLLLGWARILHLVYYRLWFCRIRPRLRDRVALTPRPLWWAWIRTRV